MSFKTRVLARALPAALAALLMPLAAQANSPYHRGSGEESFRYIPEHAQSTRTRAQVKAEVDAARTSGWLDQLQRRQSPALTAYGEPKTREQVVTEMRSESTADRAARSRLYWGAPN